jgi:fatty-acyl-CoA synthase
LLGPVINQSRSSRPAAWKPSSRGRSASSVFSSKEGRIRALEIERVLLSPSKFLTQRNEVIPCRFTKAGNLDGFVSSPGELYMNLPFARTYYDILREQARAWPNQLAAICGDRQVTYAELEGLARKAAAGLRALGLRRGARIGVLMNNCLEWLEIVFGASALGIAAVPFSTWSKLSELEYLIRDSQIRALFTVPGFGSQDFAAMVEDLIPELTAAGELGWRSSKFPSLEAVIGLNVGARPGWMDYVSFSANAEEFVPLPPGVGVSAGDDLFVLYTSGTSERPKAVRILQMGAIENGFNIGERQRLVRGDRVLLAPQLFWYYAAGNAVAATFTHAGTLVLLPKFGPAEALDAIERHQCTAIYTLPNMTRAIVRHPDFDRKRTASLRTGLTIGTPADVRLTAEQLAAPFICNVYGLTETYGNCSVTWSDAPLVERLNGQGPLLPGFQMRIGEPEIRQLVAAGSVGEVEVSGYIVPGYTGESGEIYNAASRTADGYFRTGDLGYLDVEGHFHFVSRDSEMIKTGGINVSPAEIESVFQEHWAVADAVVIGIDDVDRGQEVVAFIVLNPGMEPTEQDLLDYCKTRMSAYKVPRRLVKVDGFPVTATGKVFRKALKNHWMERYAVVQTPSCASAPSAAGMQRY